MFLGNTVVDEILSALKSQKTPGTRLYKKKKKSAGPVQKY